MKTMDGIRRGGVAVAIGVLLSAGVPVWAESAGTAGAVFLKIDPNARPTAMGGAYTALAEDVNAVAYNPGGLGRVRQSEITLMHNEYLEDVNHEYLGFVYPNFYEGTLGVDLSYLDLGSFQRYTVGAGGVPVAGGGFDASDLALRAAYGRNYSEELSWGAGLKYIRENLDNVKAQGWAVDLGVMYHPADYDRLTLGMTLLNLGPKMQYQNRHERLPLTWRGGGAYRLEEFPLVFSAELQKSIDDGWGFAAGGEYEFNEAFSLRVGYNSLFDAGSGITCGAGFKFNVFRVDYAYQPVEHMGDIHRLSLNMALGDLRQAAPAAAPAPVYNRQQPVSRPVSAPAPATTSGSPRSGYYEYAGAPAPMYVAPPPIQMLY